MRRRVVVLALALGACARSGARLVDVRFEAPGGVVVIRAEVADSPAARARGLMFRRTLAPDRGMLFVFPDTAVRRFFMKDTLIPLDLISIRGGRVVAVQGMVPCLAEPCPVTETPAADAALEVAGGVAARAGIRPGVLVDAEGLP